MEFGGFGSSNSSEGEKNIFVLAGEGNVAAVRSLLESQNKNGQDINVNCQDENGYSPLMAAASYGMVDMINYLLSKGADVNLVDVDGDSSLHHCSNVECLKILIENGGDINLKNTDGLNVVDLARQNLQEELGEDEPIELEFNSTESENISGINNGNLPDISQLDLVSEELEPEQEREEQNEEVKEDDDNDDDESDEIRKLREVIEYLESN
mmetsp:Transcript_9731/g.12153  ORF Transcript_9731/g.12153 Transcript_9731/m.12153 type:complete len:211 (-) Transcript_9731:213-845(-)|eukprot:CAMPEP_0204828666 /NCGR_PEP_ID=MMETSP1346-20131115/6554_1 /ASSEMBLY_ACC=CAM_ASM_000771 /TAXON_ID=215587 /ORGANISM="Aplanochytrium stocchinoi, Strain GSBS06" /LENGTH=210 /DNA_ID=CAMNT_0051957917 /DNA_START=90 /DNA_END=722 /DNA_ORIENTATION=+